MKKSIKEKLKCPLIGVATGFLNGIFGSGGGTAVVLFMEKFLNLDEQKSHATAIAIILPLTVVSLFFYTKNGYFNPKLVILTSAGGVFGGLTGAMLLKKMKPKYIRLVFGICMIAAAVRMVFK